MSTPLYVRTPTVGNGTVSILGASLAAYSGATPMVDLTTIVSEATLIEELAWCAQVFSTVEGMLILAISDGVNRRLYGAFDLAAGTATMFANDRIKFDALVIPVGFKLVAAHNIKDGGAAYTHLDLVPLGGVVR